MQLGIFAKTFQRPSLEEVMDGVAACDLRCIQFNFASAGLPSMPEEIEADLVARIRRATAVRQISIAGISGTFNMIHPDVKERENGLRRLETMVKACSRIGASVVTLCTGTRDPHDMWRFHSENRRPEAWSDLLSAMERVVKFAERSGVILGVEPEIGNVVDSAAKGRRLLDELRSPAVKAIIDPANLFHSGESIRMESVLEEAVDLLGRDLIMAHAKDFLDEEPIRYVAAGKGRVDFERYIELLKGCGFKGPLIVHGLEEAEVPQSLGLLRRILK